MPPRFLGGFAEKKLVSLCYDTDNYRRQLMSLLLWILLGFVIGWMARKNSARHDVEAELREAIRRRLERRADREKDAKVAEGIRLAAKQVAQPEAEPAVYTSVFEELKDEGAQDAEVPEREAVQRHAAPQPQPQPAAHQPAESVWTRDIRSLDNVSVLLYFGAFLMIAGVGLFVGLSSYGGGVKTSAVLIMALTFYCAGLAVHHAVERLRPVGLTLTAIGLICLPLTGVAAYFYTTGIASGAWIWLFTSLVSLALYAVALWQIRQSLIGYMSVFMCLSLWLSIVSVIQAPVYIFGWAMIVLGMIYLLAVRYLKLWHEVEMPLSVSASIMVPTALVLTLVYGAGTIGLGKQAITMLLAAAFYGLATWETRENALRRTYFTLAYILIPVAAALASMGADATALQTSWLVSVVSVAQLALAGFVWHKTQPTWYSMALVVGAVMLGLASLFPVPIFGGHWGPYAVLLTFIMAVYLVVGVLNRHKTYVGLGLTIALTLPAIIGFLVLEPDAPRLSIVVAYAAIGLLLLLLRRWAQPRGFVELNRFMYVVAFALAWLVGFGGAEWIPMATSIILAAAFAIVAFYERWPGALFVATTLGGIAVAQGLTWRGLQLTDSWALWLGGLGLLYYAKAKLLRRLKGLEEFAGVMLLSGLTATYLGAIAGMFAVGVNWPSTILLAVAGALTMYESYLQKAHDGLYVGAAVLVVALELALYKWGVREWQLYWYIWAAYVLVISYLQRAAAGVVAVAVLVAGGVLVGLNNHSVTDPMTVSVTLSLVSMGLYVVGKLHLLLNDKKTWGLFEQTWSLSGLTGLYVVSLGVPWQYSTDGAESWSAIMLMLAGAFTAYETYVRRSLVGMYIAAAVMLAGMQWLLYINELRNVQVYTHMWAMYFAALAWVAHRRKQVEEKKAFTLIALSVQTLPLAWQALAGNTDLGLLLLFESVAILLAGLWMRYQLVMWWGLSVAVASVLYQLRAYQFFVLVLLGAGIIGVGVFLLLRQEKK
jgi:hypothetical protein